MNSPDDGPDILSRLAHADAKVRRIALRDLLAAPPPADTLELVAARLTTIDTHAQMEEAALATRVIGRWAHASARPILETLLSRATTSALVAHEARIALDRIDLVAMGRIPNPLG